MNSNSGEMIEHIVAIGDETFLFVTGPDGIPNPTPENVDAVYNFIHDGYNYGLARLSSKKIDVRKSVSLEGYVAQQARRGHDVEGLLAKLLATSADESIFLNEASVTSALVQVLKKFVPTLGRSILYQVADCETSVLVHSRDVDFEKAQCVWLADEKSAVRAQFSVQGRFIAREQPRLRLTVIDLDPTFHPTTLIHLAEGRLSVVPINAITTVSVKDFFQQQIREAPDVVHLLYQASKFMRPALSELFGREQIPSAIADPSWGFHFRVDSAFCLANGYFISGWISDPEDRLVEVALLAGC